MKAVMRAGVGTADRAAYLRKHLRTPWEIAFWEAEASPDDVASLLGDADALITMRLRDSAPAMPQLKLLHLVGAGYDGIDFALVPQQTAVCNVYEHEYGIAEYVLAVILERLIGLSRMNSNMRKGDWRDGFYGNGSFHGELIGKTVGLVGYGHINQEVARRAKAFGTRVIAVTRTPRAADDHAEKIAGLDQLDALVAEADFVVIAVPLTDATQGLVGPAQFARMKDSAMLINVARGPVVDEDALFAACRDRRIGGAAIDVWYDYPQDGTATNHWPSRHAFHELDNVIMTPHASGWSDGLMNRRWTVIADNLDRVTDGRPLRNLIREPGGPPPA